MKRVNSLAKLPFVLMALLSLQCSGSRKGAPDWGNAETGYHLRYRFEKGEARRYRIQLRTRSTQEVMGNEQVQLVTITMVTSQTAGMANSDGNYPVQVTYDSVSVDAPGAAAGILQQGTEKIVGKSIKLVVSPLGEVVSTEGIAEIGTLPGNQSLTDMMRYFFVRMPDRPVKPGESWSIPPDDIKVQSGGADLVVHSEERTYTLDVVETDAMRITSSSKFDLKGSGNQMGSRFDISGSGENTGVASFDYKRGVLLATSADVNSEGVAEITSPQALSIPWHNTQKVTVNLLQ